MSFNVVIASNHFAFNLTEFQYPQKPMHNMSNPYHDDEQLCEVVIDQGIGTMGEEMKE